MPKLTITEPDPDENGAGLILTRAGQRSELLTACRVLDRASGELLRYLQVRDTIVRADVARRLHAIQDQVQVMRGLLAAEVPE